MLLNSKILKKIKSFLEAEKIEDALSYMEEYIEENIFILLKSRFSNLKHLKKDITTNEYDYTFERIKDSICLLAGITNESTYSQILSKDYEHNSAKTLELQGRLDILIKKDANTKINTIKKKIDQLKTEKILGTIKESELENHLIIIEKELSTLM